MAGTVAIGAKCVRNQTMLASAARTSSSAGDQFSVQGMNAIELFVDVTAVSGTSPTLDLYVQKLLADDTTWQDVAHFTQITGTTQLLLDFVSQGPSFPTVQDAALAAGSIDLTLMGCIWRLKWVITGTSPSFTFAVYGDFYGA